MKKNCLQPGTVDSCEELQIPENISTMQWDSLHYAYQGENADSNMSHGGHPELSLETAIKLFDLKIVPVSTYGLTLICSR